MNIREPAHGRRSVRRRAAVLACTVWSGLLACSQAWAQLADVTQYSEKVATDPFQKDVTNFNVNIGGSLNTGNTKAMLLNVGENFAMVRGRHGLGLATDFAYGRANLPQDDQPGFVDTVRSLRARGRYDLFLSPMDALFVAGLYRWDPFAGLDARVEGQVGYMRSLFKEDKHRFWGELGYDLTYDNYDPDPLPDPNTPGAFLTGHAVVHSARAFLGYDNQLNAAVVLLTGVEGLLNVEHPKDFRFNWDIAVRSSIVSRLQLEVRFALQFDAQPVPGKRDLDAQTKANFIYTFI
jgi:putative salt-induced outer membrane protein YdiY